MGKTCEQIKDAMAKAKRIRMPEESEDIKDNTTQSLKMQNNDIRHEDQEECHYM